MTEKLNCFQQYIKNLSEEIVKIQQTLMQKQDQLNKATMINVFQPMEHVFDLNKKCIICSMIKPEDPVSKVDKK